MKKLFVLLLTCCSLGAYAQDVKVSYRSDLGFKQGLFEFDGIQCEEITLEGKLKGKSVILSEIRCTDGKFSEKEVFNRPFSSKIDTTMVLRFYAKSISPDSIRMLIVFVDHGQDFLSIPLKQAKWKNFDAIKTYIFMETYDSALGVLNGVEKWIMTYPLNKAFPVIAYTTGIDSEVNIEGVNYESIDYCGLRNKHQNPALWYESSGIQNYVYYIIKFE